MRTNLVIVSSPSFDDDPSFQQSEEDLAIQKLVPHLAVEGLTVSILPWTSGLNVERLYANIFEPFSQFSCNELWTVVRANMLRDPVFNKQICKDQEDVLAPDSSSYKRCQTLFAVLIDNIQNAELSAIMSLLRHKVITPNVIAVCGAKSDTRAIGKPEPGSLWLLLRNL